MSDHANEFYGIPMSHRQREILKYILKHLHNISSINAESLRNASASYPLTESIHLFDALYQYSLDYREALKRAGHYSDVFLDTTFRPDIQPYSVPAYIGMETPKTYEDLCCLLLSVIRDFKQATNDPLGLLPELIDTISDIIEIIDYQEANELNTSTDQALQALSSAIYKYLVPASDRHHSVPPTQPTEQEYNEMLKAIVRSTDGKLSTTEVAKLRSLLKAVMAVAIPPTKPAKPTLKPTDLSTLSELSDALDLPKPTLPKGSCLDELAGLLTGMQSCVTDSDIDNTDTNNSDTDSLTDKPTIRLDPVPENSTDTYTADLAEVIKQCSIDNTERFVPISKRSIPEQNAKQNAKHCSNKSKQGNNANNASKRSIPEQSAKHSAKHSAKQNAKSKKYKRNKNKPTKDKQNDQE